MTHVLENSERVCDDFDGEECLCPLMSQYGVKPARSDMYPDRLVFMPVNCKRHGCQWWILNADGDGDCAVAVIANTKEIK